MCLLMTEKRIPLSFRSHRSFSSVNSFSPIPNTHILDQTYSLESVHDLIINFGIQLLMLQAWGCKESILQSCAYQFGYSLFKDSEEIIHSAGKNATSYEPPRLFSYRKTKKKFFLVFLYAKNQGGSYEVAFFSCTTDGFFRIFEKAVSELICTRL